MSDENNLPSDIRDRLEQAIREEDEKARSRIRKFREKNAREAEQEFELIRQAAEEIRDQLDSVPSIKFTINPDSVWITLADKEIWLGYDTEARKFVGEESAHSWFDGEYYSNGYEWNSAEECTDALIRFCAKYVRMARATKALATET